MTVDAMEITFVKDDAFEYVMPDWYRVAGLMAAPMMCFGGVASMWHVPESANRLLLEICTELPATARPREWYRVTPVLFDEWAEIYLEDDRHVEVELNLARWVARELSGGQPWPPPTLYLRLIYWTEFD